VSKIDQTKCVRCGLPREHQIHSHEMMGRVQSAHRFVRVVGEPAPQGGAATGWILFGVILGIAFGVYFGLFR